MKKILLLIVFCLALLTQYSKAQYVNIPDNNFKKFLMQQVPGCFNASQQLDTTCSAVINLQFMYVYVTWGTTDSIRDLEGVQYFKGLKYLSISGTGLNTIPSFPDSLTYISITDNPITSFPHFPDSLNTLYCYKNQLTSLPALPGKLSTIYCSNNQLTGLPALPNYLYYLYCDNNQLTGLPALPNTLNYLYCNNNQLSSLPALPGNLNYLNCSDNKLSSLPALPGNLNYLNCSDNKITTLPTLSTNLSSLVCDNNLISTLPGLPGSLNSLSCNNNKITSLPVLSTTNLYILSCNNNKIASLPALPSALNYLYCNNNKLASLPALPTYLYQLDCSANLLTALPATLPQSLSRLYCGYNNLHSLPAMPKRLSTLNCENDLLTSFPVVDSFVAYLNCSHNSITTLPNLPYYLNQFNCSNNQLTTLPVVLPPNLDSLACDSNSIAIIPALPSNLRSLSCKQNTGINCLPQLPTSLQGLNVTNTNITCIPNITLAMHITPTGLNQCTVANNPNSCIVTTNNNYVNIPDSNFRKYLIQNIPGCFNVQEQMDTICSSGSSKFSYGIYCNNLNIQDLTGIQYFKTINYLICSNNLLTTLSNLPSSLTYINCDNNLITKMDVPPYLNQLRCNNNLLDTMPALPDTLTYLYCEHNHLTKINLPKRLRAVSCGYNLLSSLPTLPDTLFTLNCDHNQITTLPAFPKLLEHINCANNLISIVPSSFSNNRIYYFNCDSNQISVIPPFGKDTIYYWQNFDSSSLLSVNGNTALSCLPKLPSYISNIDVRNTDIHCLPNITKNIYQILPAQMQVCNPTNNPAQCAAYPVVNGKVFFDLNNNGVKDGLEYYLPFVKTSIDSNTIGFTNYNGEYSLTADSLGTYNVTVTPSSYLFKAVPTSSPVTFNAYNTVVTQPDIAIQAAVLKDSLISGTWSWGWAAPNRYMGYQAYYYNVGTTTLNTDNTFTYDTSRLVFAGSWATPSLTTSGNTISWKDTLQPNYFGYWWNYNSYRYPYFWFKVKTTVTLGDLIIGHTNISANNGAVTAAYADTAIVVASYDPNDKHATPKLTPTQVVKGEWIEYTVNFQNTGTAQADNIVIADTLSSLLNKKEIQMVASSHNVKTSIKDNIIYFEFLNINLPDSNHNEAFSHGFVRFKVKPLSSASLSTHIDNRASIYFDYNKPVVTNTAVTVIDNLLPLHLLTYEANAENDGFGKINRVTNNWITSNEEEVAGFNVQRGTDGKTFKTVGKVAAKGGGVYFYDDNLTASDLLLTTLYYRLQMVDKNGRNNYSEVHKVYLSNNKSATIAIYPNPSKEVIYIDGKDLKQIVITDVRGRIVLQQNLLNNQPVNISGLTSGTYLITVKTTDNTITEKLIKQ